MSEECTKSAVLLHLKEKIGFLLVVVFGFGCFFFSQHITIKSINLSLCQVLFNVMCI